MHVQITKLNYKVKNLSKKNREKHITSYTYHNLMKISIYRVMSFTTGKTASLTVKSVLAIHDDTFCTASGRERESIAHPGAGCPLDEFLNSWHKILTSKANLVYATHIHTITGFKIILRPLLVLVKNSII